MTLYNIEEILWRCGDTAVIQKCVTKLENCINRGLHVSTSKDVNCAKCVDIV